MSRISCVRSTTRAVERVLERLLLRRLELVVDDQHLGVRVLVGLLQLLELALADVRARIRARALLHELGDRLDARGARELAQLAELLLGVGGLGEDGQHEPALGLDAAGVMVGSWRVVTTGIVPRLSPMSALADRLRRPHARAREHPVREPQRGGDRGARPFARPRLVRARVRGRGRVRLGAPTPRGQAARRARRPLRHGAGAGQHPGRDRGRRRRRARRERHEGRPRGDARARAGARRRGVEPEVDVALLAFGKEELPAEHSPLPALFDALAARARGRARDPARADRQHDPGRLPRQPERADRLPRRQRPLGAAVDGRERDREGARRAAAVRRDRAAAGRDRRAHLHGGREHHADRGRDRDAT